MGNCVLHLIRSPVPPSFSFKFYKLFFFLLILQILILRTLGIQSGEQMPFLEKVSDSYYPIRN